MSEAVSKNERGFIEKFMAGDFGLAKTFWLFAFLPNFVLSPIVRVLPLGAGMVLAVILTPYLIFAMIAIWRAAAKYEGKKIWPILAKVWIVLSIVSELAALYMFASLI